MPSSVRRIVAENAAALAGAGTAPASSAITALATTSGATTRARRCAQPNAGPLLLIASPSQRDGPLTDDARHNTHGREVCPVPERWREAVDGELSGRLRAPRGAAPLGGSAALQHRGRRLRPPSAGEAGDDPRALLGRGSRGALGRDPGPVQSLCEPTRPPWGHARRQGRRGDAA